MNIPIDEINTPAYVIDEDQLIKNAEILDAIRKRTGCKIILALKAFSMFSVFPLLRDYLDGTTASSLNEARLGAEEFGKEVHIYQPAYRDDEFPQICNYATQISFNSFAQWKRLKKYTDQLSKQIECGIRINPEFSTTSYKIYDPCARFSRLGVTVNNFEFEDLRGITGLHFHTLCEQNADALESTLREVEKKFGKYLPGIKWLNFGGGHYITGEDYDIELLCDLIVEFKDKYGLEIILEPGEAVALNAGVLVSTVMDIIHNEKDIAILDTSAAAHMPDVLEMPYRPNIMDAGEPDKFAYNYILSGNTCLAGDIIGEYSFDKPLQIGSKIVLMDMAHYTMVKNNTFNGINLPSIGVLKQVGSFEMIKQFEYNDFRSRLS